MRIGIDARLFGPKTGGGGLGRYVEELILHLEEIDESNEYIIFLRQENWNEYNPKRKNFKKVLAPWRWYTLSEQINMPKLIKEQNLDLFHVPHFNVPIFSKIPLVVTIHDLIPLRFPSIKSSKLNPIYFWIKFLGYKLILWLGIRRAKTIITVSGATANDLLSKFKIKKEKIQVIYSGYTPITNISSPKTEIVAKINKPYLLAVGNAYPHKNIDSLIAAFCDIIKEQKDVFLVITGPDDKFRLDLKKMVKKNNAEDNIFFTGFVDESTLDYLYRNSTAYIVPSLLEGFGFPGLEAQIRNIPVLASDIEAHRETFGSGALYFDPKDIKSIKESILKIFSDPELRTTLAALGATNTVRFSWQKTAEQTLDVYRNSVKNKI